MAIELRHLRYFVAVAEELHFGRAAEQLHIAQPALSQQIKALEVLLGSRLLNRTKRSVELTDAGALFLDEARLTLRQAARTENIGRCAGRGELGRIEIGYVGSAAFTGVLTGAVLEFRKSRPAVTLQLTEMEGLRQLDELVERRLDVGFIRRPAPCPPGIITITLRREPIMLALPADHPLAARKAVPAAALAGEEFILPRIATGVSFHEHTMAVGRHGGFHPAILHRGRDFVSIASMVGVGLGVAIVPESLQCVRLPNVAYRPLEDVVEYADLSAAFRCDEGAPAVLAFITQLRAAGLKVPARA